MTAFSPTGMLSVGRRAPLPAWPSNGTEKGGSDRRNTARVTAAMALAVLALAPGATQALELRQLEVRREGATYLLRVEARLDASPERVFALLYDPLQASRINPSVRSVRLLPASDAPNPAAFPEAAMVDRTRSSTPAATADARAVASTESSLRIAVESQSCFATFCRTLRQVQRLHRRSAGPGAAGGEITAVTEPSPDGSFASGLVQLRVFAVAAGEPVAPRDEASGAVRMGVAAAERGTTLGTTATAPGPVATWISLTSRSEPSFWLPPLLRGWAVAQRLKQDTRIGLENLERLAREP